jgi:choline monooxygenase
VDFGRLPEPPSYFACTTGGLPVVVTRDTEGDLRAFLNVCRHRGSQVVSGAGCGGVVFRERVHHAVDANWKIAVENYLECYHCPVAHPDFSALVDVDPDAYVLEESGEVWSLLRQRARRRRQLRVPPRVARVEDQRLSGAGEPVDRPRLAGVSPPHHRVLDYFFAHDVDEACTRELIEFDDRVGEDDRALVESVQRGVVSCVVDRGRLLPESERLIALFHT